ncbi:hypothetical protein EHS25_004185 [Saitozyma podzolica]|uniref:Uncharacterized protein n=1 Tax=Saitozyma podzolica TaxID=1890683 RepID=A0A427YTH9_9TREE|nr:hypothetical protein EHS25_004185 [Saitozyma podzolica]
MGSSASKAARRLPTTTPTQARPVPKWAGARTPHSDQIIPEGMERPSHPPPGAGVPPEATRADYGMADTGAEPGVTGRARAGFSGEKDEAVKRDAMDPQFMANLSKLGQVSIHDAGKFMRTPAPAQRTLNARRDEYTSTSAAPPPEHLTAPLLISLLDRLKTLPPGTEPSKVYGEYGMDANTMSEIRRWVNSPSVGEDEVRVEDGNRIVEMKAIWVDSASGKQAGSRPQPISPPS